ncbi:hypothetical protein PHYPSEUDO_003853 [Phytophthora pseudosyringae]|uniref:Serine-threonine/tyrosine-protein kinase catalytic domain-containing protein n=1 Tax=Phytophthora pseudosyringae TaxID=221518 RepID=A0A8T1VUY3_9STRA|nr:hypothetical protein PHYPSEUDO_003853 [Phytophthora pseudosyringae]
MTHWPHRYALALLLAWVLAVGSWPRPSRAVDVGEAEESSSSSSCPNATTVSIVGSSSKAAKTATSSSSNVQITDASTCTSSVVKVSSNSAGERSLDLRHRDIAAVASLPAVTTVRLDNNELRAFSTSNNISELYMSNNSIPTINAFKFPTALTVLDLANNALGDVDGAKLPSSLQYLNLSGNPIGSLSNISFPSTLLRLDMADGSVATLENFSLPSSVTALNFSGNPITTVRGVIFPNSLTELTLIAKANVATAATTSTVSVDEARALQTTVEVQTARAASVLEEFEVRQSDADRFDELTLWDVSTTSTLSCSDPNANPRYVQDTMLCVLSDSEFVDKYKSVVVAASSGSMSGSMWGTDGSFSKEVERIALRETLDQRRSWFLIGAAALLLAFTVLLFVNGLCVCLRRKARGAAKEGKGSQPAMKKAASARPNSFCWQETASTRPDEEVRHLLSSDPLTTTDGNSSQPEPEFDVEDGDSTAKKNALVHLQQELPRREIEGSLITRRELLSATALDQNEAAETCAGESSSPFIYFKAEFHHRPIVLKTLSIASHLGRKGDNGASTELWGFVEEIRLSSTLSHPQIVAFYGFVKMTRFAEQSGGEGVALVVEYMNKGDLNTFIQYHKRTLQSHQASEREANSMDNRAGWNDDAGAIGGDDESDDGYDEGILRSDGPSRWNWRSSSAAYKSKLSIAIELDTYECSSAEHSVMDDTEVPMLNHTDKEHPSTDGEGPTLLMFRCQAFQPEVRPTAEEVLQELRQMEQTVKSHR